MPRSLSSVFVWEFYCFRSYVQVFNPFWVNYCVWSSIVVQLSLHLSNFPNIIYWRGGSFPHCVSLSPIMYFPTVYPLSEIGHIWVSLFLGSLFCSTDLISSYTNITLSWSLYAYEPWNHRLCSIICSLFKGFFIYSRLAYLYKF